MAKQNSKQISLWVRIGDLNRWKQAAELEHRPLTNMIEVAMERYLNPEARTRTGALNPNKTVLRRTRSRRRVGSPA